MNPPTIMPTVFAWNLFALCVFGIYLLLFSLTTTGCLHFWALTHFPLLFDCFWFLFWLPINDCCSRVSVLPDFGPADDLLSLQCVDKWVVWLLWSGVLIWLAKCPRCILREHWKKFCENFRDCLIFKMVF